MFLYDSDPLPSTTSSSHRVPLKYEPSESSFTDSSMCGPPNSTESRNILTTEITDNSIQNSDLASDSDPGDDFGARGPILWSLENRDSVNLVNNRGQNFAHICAQLGNQCLLINVIEKGAHIHTEDVNGRTPLDFARLYRDEDAIDILEGDWEDNVQNVISAGWLPVSLLHRYMPECVLAIQTIKVRFRISKGSGEFVQARAMSIQSVQAMPPALEVVPKSLVFPRISELGQPGLTQIILPVTWPPPKDPPMALFSAT